MKLIKHPNVIRIFEVLSNPFAFSLILSVLFLYIETCMANVTVPIFVPYSPVSMNWIYLKNLKAFFPPFVKFYWFHTWGNKIKIDLFLFMVFYCTKIRNIWYSFQYCLGGCKNPFCFSIVNLPNWKLVVYGVLFMKIGSGKQNKDLHCTWVCKWRWALW